MPGRLDEMFQIDGGAFRNRTQSPCHGILYIAALTSRDNMRVGTNHRIYMGVIEIISENVDRITAEEFETAGSQQAVPKFLQLDGCGEFPRTPQDPHHLAVGPKTAIQGPSKQRLRSRRLPYDKIDPNPGSPATMNLASVCAASRNATRPRWYSASAVAAQNVELPCEMILLMFGGGDHQNRLASL